MKIVIDIPKVVYEKILSNSIGVVEGDPLYNAVLNGIPLPKGHGDLIDADELLEQSYCIDDSATLSTRYVVNAEEIEKAPVIIEAKGETE